MAQDPRTARTLLKLCREFAEFDEVEVESGGVTVRVKRSAGQAAAPAPAKTEPGKAKPRPEPRSAVDSLRDNPPPFYHS